MQAFEVGAQGFAPIIKIQPAAPRENPEQAKYEKVWQHEEYRQIAPGEYWAAVFRRRVPTKPWQTIIDFGAGTGRGALMLALLTGCKVKMLDFADNCLDEDVRNALTTQAHALSFDRADLTQPIEHKADFGYCTDVMEHIQPELVPQTLRNVIQAAGSVFWVISTVEDRMGALIGAPLHLTVKPGAWWVREIERQGGVVYWWEEIEGAVVIFSGKVNDVKFALPAGTVNVDEAVLNGQIQANVQAGWTNLRPYKEQDREIILLAGGPSLNDHVEEIRALRQGGAALVTMNGTYHWALDNAMKVSAQIILDARAFNARFAGPVMPDTKYLIASQCAPCVLTGLPRDRTILWHSGMSNDMREWVRKRVGYCFPVLGGSTVMLRAIPLMRMLGFRRMHIFGFDSCVRDGEHHAYRQVENDGEPIIPVTCGGRTFECTPWQAHQAGEFRDLVAAMGDHVELAVYGDGLIAHMIQTGAEMAQGE
jgi:hypothetical protein